jgi:hypothetical protein
LVAQGTVEELKRMGEGGNLIEVEVRGRGVAAVLKKIAGVLRVEEIKKDYFLLETQPGKDLREEIFKTVVSHRFTLLTLVSRGKALEEVFAQLTA